MTAVPRAPELALTWLGHATVLVEVDGARILTDPLLRPRFLHVRRRAAHVEAIPGGPRVDAVVISHLHWDHFDLPSLRALGPDVPVIVPRGAGRLAERSGLRNVEELRIGQALDVAGTTVEATWANHSGFRPPLGPRAEACGYLIGRSRIVYFAGDTGMFPQLTELRGGVHAALIPVGGWGPTLRGGHLDARAAAEALTVFEPRLALPIHWGTYWPAGVPLGSRFSAPGPRFVEHAAALAPDTDARLWAVAGTERVHLGR